MSMSFDVDVKGPFFTGNPSAEIGRAVADGIDDVGDEAVRTVQGELDAVLVDPTGRYRRSIEYTTRKDNSEAFIGDNRAVYGPWLAGTGSRNERSRFRGYAHWRRAMQRMEQRASAITEAHVSKAVEKFD